MKEYLEAISYGGAGILAWLIVKTVLPGLKAMSSRASVEGSVYDKAKDSISHAYKQLDRQRERYEELWVEYEKLQRELADIKELLTIEQKERRELERKINELLKGEGDE